MIIQSVSQITSLSRPRYLILLEIILGNYLYYLKTKRLMVESLIIKIVLINTYIVISRLLRWYYNAEIKIPGELRNIDSGRFIIVANHHKAVDPYLILATLPFSTYRKLLPIRFFTANIFLKHWWQRCLMMPFGCFRAYSTDGKLSGVKGALQLSDKGQSLFIFPEGKRVKASSKVEIKVGVGYLTQRRDFTIIPVFINYKRSAPRWKTKVHWGKPFKITQTMRSEDLNILSTKIFKKVQRLST